MKCELSARLAVQRLVIFAEMAWLERRPELTLLCQAAQKDKGRLTAAVVQQALPGVGEPGAANVVAWCRDLGLCDAHGGLTTLAQQAVQQDAFPVPEQGLFEVWVAEHPLLGARILHAERRVSRPDARFEAIKPLPLTPECNRCFTSVVHPAERFVLRKLLSSGGQPGCVVHHCVADCRLRWHLDLGAGQGGWRLAGHLDDKDRRAIQHQPEPAWIDPWRVFGELARRYLSQAGTWDEGDRHLSVAFSALAEPEIGSFQRSVTLARVEVTGIGAFEDVQIEGLPLKPRSRDDAAQWAMHLLDRRLASRAYLTRAALRQQFSEVVQGTPLQPWQPPLPPHEDLLERTRKSPGTFFALAAPVDLSPLPVGPAELAGGAP